MPLDLPSSSRRPVQAAIPVALVSDDPLVLAALRARLSGAPELWVVADPNLAAVIVWDPPTLPRGEFPSLPLEPRADAEPPAVVALVGESTDPMPLLAAGVRGLVGRDVEAGRLRAAILAAQLGLSVLDEDPADAIVAAWSPRDEPSRPSQPVVPNQLAMRSADRLTPREREVLELLADGLSNRAIGTRLGISAHTVKFHVDALLDKLAARSRTQVVVKAVRAGLLELV
jgi:two-component system nitrate/nitrite response regulator NarL